MRAMRLKRCCVSKQETIRYLISPVRNGGQLRASMSTTITFIEHNGTRHDAAGEPGETLMQVALNHDVPGLLAECGGNCSCATCHAIVDPAMAGCLPPPDDGEQMALEGVLEPAPTSRLTCQLRLQPELQGLVLRLPERQI